VDDPNWIRCHEQCAADIPFSDKSELQKQSKQGHSEGIKDTPRTTCCSFLCCSLGSDQSREPLAASLCFQLSKLSQESLEYNYNQIEWT
jgi:hypothetical protein